MALDYGHALSIKIAMNDIIDKDDYEKLFSVADFVTSEDVVGAIGRTNPEAAQKLKEIAAKYENSTDEDSVEYRVWEALENFYVSLSNDGVEDGATEFALSLYELENEVDIYKDFPLIDRLVSDVMPKLEDGLRIATIESEEALTHREHSPAPHLVFYADLEYLWMYPKGEDDDKCTEAVILDNSSVADFDFFTKERDSFGEYELFEISTLENYKELAQQRKDELFELVENISSYVYHYSERHSDLSENKVAVDLKTYSIDGYTPSTTREIIDGLVEKGVSLEYIQEQIDDPEAFFEEEMSLVYNALIETAIGELDNIPVGGVTFDGMTGQRGGYGVFLFDDLGAIEKYYEYGESIEDWSVLDFEEEGIDLREKIEPPQNLLEFSEWIEESHKNLLNGKYHTKDNILETIINANGLPSAEEYEAMKIDAARERETGLERTGDFVMEGYARVKFWGGDKGGVGMDKVEFHSDNLTSAEVFGNLNDGCFGVEELLGGYDIVIAEKVLIVERFKDNGEVRKTPAFETIVHYGEISSPDDDRIIKEAKGNGYEPLVPDNDGSGEGGAPKAKKTTAKKSAPAPARK